MKSLLFSLCTLCVLTGCGMTVTSMTDTTSDKLVIAHRGASAYLPEHTLAAKAMAYAQGAHYLEQDVVMTRDGELIVYHDLILDRNTDVRERFPDRARADGHFYVIDFDLEEIRQLRLSERFVPDNGTAVARYPERFPLWQSDFHIPTLAQEIELVQGLNLSTGRHVGIYPEVKSPWFHHQEGKDLAAAVVETLKRYGYTSEDDRVYLQTFDFNELKRLSQELLPAHGMSIPLVQLIADNDWQESFVKDASGTLVPYDYGWMHTREGMEQIAQYAVGVGPHMSMVVDPASDAGAPRISPLVAYAHAAGMQIHPYTFRKDTGLLPDYVDSFEELLALFYFEAGVDGIFTDFPDLAVEFLRNQPTGR